MIRQAIDSGRMRMEPDEQAGDDSSYTGDWDTDVVDLDFVSVKDLSKLLEATVNQPQPPGNIYKETANVDYKLFQELENLKESLDNAKLHDLRNIDHDRISFDNNLDGVHSSHILTNQISPNPAGYLGEPATPAGYLGEPAASASSGLTVYWTVGVISLFSCVLIILMITATILIYRKKGIKSQMQREINLNVRTESLVKIQGDPEICSNYSHHIVFPDQIQSNNNVAVSEGSPILSSFSSNSPLMSTFTPLKSVQVEDGDNEKLSTKIIQNHNDNEVLENKDFEDFTCSEDDPHLTQDHQYEDSAQYLERLECEGNTNRGLSVDQDEGIDSEGDVSLSPASQVDDGKGSKTSPEEEIYAKINFEAKYRSRGGVLRQTSQGNGNIIINPMHHQSLPESTVPRETVASPEVATAGPESFPSAAQQLSSFIAEPGPKNSAHGSIFPASGGASLAGNASGTVPLCQETTGSPTDADRQPEVQIVSIKVNSPH